MSFSAPVCWRLAVGFEVFRNAVLAVDLVDVVADAHQAVTHARPTRIIAEPIHQAVVALH